MGHIRRSKTWFIENARYSENCSYKIRQIQRDNLPKNWQIVVHVRQFGFGQMSFGKLSLTHNNDLPDNVFFSLALLFANDLKLICKVHDHASLHGINKLKEGVHSLHIWSDATFLCFNTKKCEYKANRRNKPGITNTAFSLGTEPVRPTSSVRDLDLIINENLDWSEHIATRVNRARKVLFLLRRNTPNLLSSESKSCLSRSNINPTLLFASEC